MPSASIEITVSTTDEERPRMLQVSVKDEAGLPVKGLEIHLAIAGHGSFEASQWVTAQKAVTNAEGCAFTEWWEFPRYQPRRDLKSRVEASCQVSGYEVRIVDLDKQGGIRFSGARPL